MSPDVSAVEAQPTGDVVLYEAPDGQVRLDVRLERETVWLTQAQMAQLFERDKSVISRHLQSVYRTGELEREATAAKTATVQREGRREVAREVEYFNLDAILSVGYRVNSKRGTQFRIWATRTLRDHLLRGYSLNERRLRETGLADIQQAITLLARTLDHHALVTDEGRALLDVVQRYTRTWRLLFEYDEGRLPEVPARPIAPTAPLDLEAAHRAIDQMRQVLAARGEATALFGLEPGDQLAGILRAIEQTFDGQPLYPSVEARAAHLLYFIIKDHPFIDGNKRIGSLLFLDYLRRNGALLRPDGTPRFSDNALAALALLVAESDPSHKPVVIRVILSLLAEDEQ
jgi:prophage maintenance system killer protein